MQDQINQSSQVASFTEARGQLKAQFSSLLGFFQKIPQDIVTSSEKLKQLPENNPLNFKKIFENKTYEEKQKAKAAERITKESDQVVPTDNEQKEENKDLNREEAGEQTKIELSPPQEKKDGIDELVMPKTEETQIVLEHSSGPRYDSFKDMLGSIGNFLSLTVTNVEKSSSQVITKLQTEGWPKLKPKSNSVVTVEEYKVEAKKEEVKKEREKNPNKERMEEVKRLKKTYEHQLKSLSSELVYLEKLEKDMHSDKNNLSREHMRRKKSFRIVSDANTHLHKERTDKSADFGKISRQGKKLAPLDDLRTDKCSEAGKTTKTSTTSSQPLYVYMRLEKEFQQNVVFPELEARKEKLKAKRELYKPMEEKEFREHALKYEEALRKHTIDKQTEKAAKVEGVEQKNDKPVKLYKSVAFQKTLEQEKEEKAKADKKVEDVKNLKDKQVKYGKLVKEMFFPKVERDDPISKQNIRDLIERSAKAEAAPVRTFSLKEDEFKFKVKRNQMMNRDFSHKSLYRYSPEKSKLTSQKDFVDLRDEHRHQPRQNNSPFLIEEATAEQAARGDMETKQGDYEEPMIRKSQKDLSRGHQRISSISPKKGEKAEKSPEGHNKEPEVVKKPYPNYLSEIRKKRIEQEKKGIKVKYAQWEKHLKAQGVTHKEKVMNILDDVERIEHQVKLKEEKLRLLGAYKHAEEPVDLQDQVGDMYLQSIKAKLAILNDI